MTLIKWEIPTPPAVHSKKAKKLPQPRRRPKQVIYTKGNKNKVRDNTYQGHVDQILTVAASADGKFVVTGGRDRRLIVWNAADLKPLRVFTQHRDAVTGLAFRRGTNQLYSSAKDRTIKTWSLDELAYVETLFGHQDEVVDVAALAQERCISVGARDRTARLWKVVEETQLVFRGGGGGEKKSKLPSSKIYAEGSIDRVAMIDEEMFVTGSENGTLSLWTLHKKKPVFTFPLAHGLDPALRPEEASAEQHPDPVVPSPPQPRWITALATIPYSDVILSGSWDGQVRAWKVSEDKRRIEALGPVGIAGTSPSVINGVVNPANGEDDGRTAAPTKSTQDIPDEHPVVRGVINDLSVFERGERGKDGICIVAAVGTEHRLGRWKKMKGKNGAVVFEVARTSPVANVGADGKVKDAEVNGDLAKH